MIHDLAVHFTRRMLAKALSVPCKTRKHPLTFNADSSSGLTGKKTGFPKTCDFLDTEAFHTLIHDTNHIPIEIMNYKAELLDIEADLKRNKLRLVSCSDKTFLAKQKILFDNQNESFKNNFQSSWIKYGLVKQYGGFDELVAGFEPYSLISLSDVSGYDKSAVLSDVYDIRAEFLILSEDPEENLFQRELLDYVTYYTLNPFRVLPDGNIVSNEFSNSSGQNNTTTDNCILHLIIIFNLLIKLYTNKHGITPTYEEIINNANAAIYSDDKVLGITEQLLPSSLEEFIEIERSTYLEYGMVIKKTASKAFLHPSGDLFLGEDSIEFLGSTSLWNPELSIYSMVPRTGKLTSSLTQKIIAFNDDDLTPEQQYSKLIQIYSLLKVGLVDEKLVNSVYSFITFMESEYPLLCFEFQDIRDAYTHGQSLEHPNAFSFIQTGNQSIKYSQSFLCNRFNGENFFGFESGWMDGFNNYLITMQRVEKFEKLLNRLAQRTGMTDEGKRWLTAAIDPFHDTALAVSGYPDMAGGSSIVQCVKQTTSITINPSDFAGGADLLIRFEPLTNFYNTFGNAFDINGIDYSTDGTQSGFGGLSIRYGVPGADLTQPGPVQFTALQVPHTMIKRRLRIIAAGFEAINATPELYKGGSVTVFRQEQSLDRQILSGLIRMPNNDPTYTGFEVILVQPGPSSEGNALLLSGSRTWDAAAGCYCVCTQQTMANPPVYPRLTGVMETTAYANRTLSFDNNGAGLPQSANYFCSTANNNSNRFNNTMMVPIPYNSSGAYFTGLPANSVIKINCNWWVERFPSEIDGDLTVLSTPSCCYDPIAMDAYAQIVKLMPIGVPVKENGLGDWFAGCIASVIDSMIGAPVASTILRVGNALVSPSTNQGTSSPYSDTRSARAITQQKSRNPQKLPKGSPGRQLQKMNKQNRSPSNKKFKGPQRPTQ